MHTRGHKFETERLLIRHFNPDDWQDFDTWELGYVFNENYHKKGYATEAARALLDDVYRNHNARRVVAMCNPQNQSSWKLLEQLKFRREGHLIIDFHAE